MDTELVKRAQHGDKEAFTSLAAAMADRFLAASRRILRDLALAEDATQQALLSVWRDLPQLRDPARFEAWSYRLLVRACYAEAGRARRWVPNIRALPVDEPVATDEMSSVVDRDQLERGFRRLSLIIGRWWSCTTTWTCRSRKSPKRSASRWERPPPDFITRCAGSARRSTPTRDPRHGRLRNER